MVSSLQLVLDSNGPFTNLDIITGRVQVYAVSDTRVSHITVKLEGESRTRLLAPPRPGFNERPRPSIEIHKLLYKMQTVFPPGGGQTLNTRQQHIIPPGSHSFPFSFKIPINNACLANKTLSTNMSFPGLNLDATYNHNVSHVKTTLPPSIYFAGEAEIRYYMKCTVNLTSVIKPNPRAFRNLTFFPIEPPRPAQDGETYARRQHQFINDNSTIDRKGSTASIFAKMRMGSADSTPTSPSTSSLAPARFSLDARLPNPAILTCCQSVPLRLLVKELSERQEQLYLQTLQVELIGHTFVRAHDAGRTEHSSWVLCSRANIHQTIGGIADAVGTELEINPEFWRTQPLPDSVPPSFKTCNISRKYELKVSVGLSFGGMHGKGQFIVLPLSMNVEVYSGITPPPELLKRSEGAPANHPSKLPTYAAAEPSVVPSASNAGPPEGGYDDAPPSYEDAIAETVGPVTGPRPEYRPPVGSQGEESTITDVKR